MMAQFGVQGRLDQRLLEGRAGVIDRFALIASPVIGPVRNKFTSSCGIEGSLATSRATLLALVGITRSLTIVMPRTQNYGQARRVRTDHAPANFTTIKHMAHNLLRTATSKDSLHLRRKVAAWDDNFPASLIAR
jgi:hypothetical protein